MASTHRAIGIAASACVQTLKAGPLTELATLFRQMNTPPAEWGQVVTMDEVSVAIGRSRPLVNNVLIRMVREGKVRSMVATDGGRRRRFFAAVDVLREFRRQSKANKGRA